MNTKDEQWVAVAVREGFQTEALMWAEVYTAAGGSLSALAKRFDCDRMTVRSRLTLCGIPVRRQGKPEQPLSDEELDTILSEGIATAARRLGLPYGRLHGRVQVAIAKRRKLAQNAAKR